MRTPVPPPCPPRAKTATTDGSTLATTATRSASDLRASGICAAAKGVAARSRAREETAVRMGVIQEKVDVRLVRLRLSARGLDSLVNEVGRRALSRKRRVQAVH